MTWGAPLTFGRNVGKVTTTEFRMAIVKNGKTLGMCIVIPGITAKELGWTAQTSLDLSPGEGAHWGWIRLSPSQSPGARRLHTTSKSGNLRLKTPLWPWLIGRESAPRALEVVENRIALQSTTMQNGEAVVDVHLPAWACPPAHGEAAAPRDEPPQPTQQGRARRLLDTMPHPLSPALPARREPRTQQERAAST